MKIIFASPLIFIVPKMMKRERVAMRQMEHEEEEAEDAEDGM